MMMQKIGRIVTSLQDNAWYAFALVFLAVTSLFFLGYETSSYARPEIAVVTERLDLVIATMFMCDFLFGLFFNQKYTRGGYWHKNWLDFIASIPLTADVVRMLRIFRVLRAIRVISVAAHFYFARRRYRSIKEHHGE